MNEDMFRIGVITSTHGLKGEVKVFPTTDDPARFKKLKKCFIRTKSGDVPVEKKSCKFFKNMVILSFSEFNDINEIEKYKGCELYVTREDAVPLEEDEFYIADVIDAEVFEDNGKKLGTLVDVMQTGANDVFVVKMENGKEVLLPVIKDCVLDINAEEKKDCCSHDEWTAGLTISEADMYFHIMTLFPEMVLGGLNESITGKAIEKGLIGVDAVNIRDFAGNRYGHVDDYTYGGGAGMLMQPGPVYDAYQHVLAQIAVRKEKKGTSAQAKKVRVLYMTPQGQPFKQCMAEEYAKEEDLVLLCGHYEGIDERVLEMIVTDYVSIGDFVLTGGELPAMMIVDATSRLVPGVLGSDESAVYESFYDGLLEYPQYTRPEEFMGKKVPEVLLSGHHKNIEEWRYEQSMQRTQERRPDLYEIYVEAHREELEKRRRKKEEKERKRLRREQRAKMQTNE